MNPIKNKKDLETTINEIRNYAYSYLEKYNPSKQQLKTHLFKKFLKKNQKIFNKKEIFNLIDATISSLVDQKLISDKYYSDAKTSWIRKRARTQNLWLLQLAGYWHPCHEVKTPHTRPHLMRCMLVSNLAVDQVLLTYRCSEIFGWTEGGISCPNDINKSICYKL